MSVTSTLYIAQTLKSTTAPYAVKASLSSNKSTADVDYSTGKADLEATTGSVDIGHAAPTGSPRTQVVVICSDPTVTLTAAVGTNLVEFQGELIFGGSEITPLNITNTTLTPVEIEWVVIHEPVPAP
jgi:hypothetical protein